MSTAIKAIIFDLDGVLVEAKKWHYEALNRALNLYGYNISLQDHLTLYDGLPTREKLKILSGRVGLPVTYHKLVNDLKQMYTLDLIEDLCEPIDEQCFAIKRLKDEGYRLAVASNSVRASVHRMLQKSDTIDFFDLILSNQDVQKPKPNPEIYFSAAQQLGVQPSECLVLEDNHNGIAAAQAAGANLLVIENVAEVTYDNINNFLQKNTQELV